MVAVSLVPLTFDTADERHIFAAWNLQVQRHSHCSLGILAVACSCELSPALEPNGSE